MKAPRWSWTHFQHVRHKLGVHKKDPWFKCKGAKGKRMPPYIIEVTKHGKIDGAYDGKNEWDVTIKGLVPRILNMAVMKVGEQNLTDMVERWLNSAVNWIKSLNMFVQGWMHEASKIVCNDLWNLNKLGWKESMQSLLGNQHALWEWMEINGRCLWHIRKNITQRRRASNWLLQKM